MKERPRKRGKPGRGTEVGKLAIKPLASDESCFKHGDDGGMLEAVSEIGWFFFFLNDQRDETCKK